jgi:hypothetical protein
MILQKPVAYRSFFWSGQQSVLFPSMTSTSWQLFSSATVAPIPPPGGLINGCSAYLLCNNGPSDIRVRFGASAKVHVDPNSANSIVVPAQASVLVDESEPAAAAWTSSQGIWLATVAPNGAGKLTVYSGITRKLILFEDLGASTDPMDLINSSGGNPFFTSNQAAGTPS